MFSGACRGPFKYQTRRAYAASVAERTEAMARWVMARVNHATAIDIYTYIVPWAGTWRPRWVEDGGHVWCLGAKKQVGQDTAHRTWKVNGGCLLDPGGAQAITEPTRPSINMLQRRLRWQAGAPVCPVQSSLIMSTSWQAVQGAGTIRGWCFGDLGLTSLDA